MAVFYDFQDAISGLTVEQLREQFPNQWDDFLAECEAVCEEQAGTVESYWEDTKQCTIDAYGEDDKPAQNEAFANMVDYMQKDGIICATVADVVDNDDF